MALVVCAEKALGLGAGDIIDLLDLFDVRYALTPRESAYLIDEPVEDEVVFRWGNEASAALLWAARLLPDLPGLDTPIARETVADVLLNAGNWHDLAGAVHLAKPAEIDAARVQVRQTYDRCLTTVQDTGALPEDVHYAVLHQRTWAFEWLLDATGSCWDDVGAKLNPINRSA